MNDILQKNLNLLNEWLRKENKKIILHLIGGYALFLKGVGKRYTVDIDSVYEIVDEDVIEEIQKIAEKEDCPGWFDLSASSISLPIGYKLRLNKEIGYSNIEVYTLSRQDLISLKVGAYYVRKETTQRDFADIVSLHPSSDELDTAFDFVLKSYGKELHGKFLKDFQNDLIEIRREIDLGIGN